MLTICLIMLSYLDLTFCPLTVFDLKQRLADIFRLPGVGYPALDWTSIMNSFWPRGDPVIGNGQVKDGKSEMGHFWIYSFVFIHY